MYNMFKNCKNLKKLDLSSFETDKCLSFHGMFDGIDNLTVYVNKQMKHCQNLIDSIPGNVTIENKTKY